jgi:hypothetical protein
VAPLMTGTRSPIGGRRTARATGRTTTVVTRRAVVTVATRRAVVTGRRVAPRTTAAGGVAGPSEVVTAVPPGAPVVAPGERPRASSRVKPLVAMNCQRFVWPGLYLYAPRPRRWAAEQATHNYARRGLSMSPREHSSRNSCHYLDELYLFYTSSIRCFSAINDFHFVLSNTGSWMVDMDPEHLPFVHVAGLWTQPPASNPHATCDKCGFGCHTKKDCTYGLYHILYSWWLQRALVLNRKRRSGSCSSRTAFRQALSIPTRARRLQIEKDAYLLNFAEILTWYEVVLNLFTLTA